ncbi:MAG TPA: phage holin family protein [Opitutus sp.]|nr:phage holin family protein [Opitutus sp.]
MDRHAPAVGGLLDSLRGLIESLFQSAHRRVQLLAVELHEEKFRLIKTFVWISAAAFAAIMAITFTSLVIVYLFWDTARLAVLIAFAVLYVIAFLVIAWRFRMFVARMPKPFEDTIAELEQDSECIRPKS